MYEEERFIFENLKHLKTKRKDIRVLLLHPESDDWRRRAELVIENRLQSESDINLDDYLKRCQDAEHQLKHAKAKIDYYRDNPRWRIYLFDKRAFISRYFGPPEAADLVEGHLNAVAAFDVAHPMFDWFYWEFKKHCPQQWKNQLPYHWE